MKLTASSHRLSVAGFRVGRAREEWRGEKKEKKIQRCFFLHAFLPTTSTSNKRASTRFRETWLIHYSDHETWITPTSGPRGQFRGLLTTSSHRGCQRFSLKKIIRVNLIFSLVAWFLAQF